MAIWILFPLLVCLLYSAVPSTANMEVDALYSLRRAVNDPQNVLQSWDPTLVDPCTWFHVTCDSDNQVTRLDLGNAKLSGKLVPDLGKLERLQYLLVYLYHKNLTGSIPPSLSNLRFLRLSSNRLTGKIPRELTKLPNHKILDLANNDLCDMMWAAAIGAFTLLL